MNLNQLNFNKILIKLNKIIIKSLILLPLLQVLLKFKGKIF